MIKDLIEIGNFVMPPTAKHDLLLSKLLTNIVNTYDFIDYGVLISNTDVYFDVDDFNVIIRSTPYFEYVARGGVELLDLFMTDGIFLVYIQEKYKIVTEKYMDKLRYFGELLVMDMPLPKLTIMTDMTDDSVKALRKNVKGGRRH